MATKLGDFFRNTMGVPAGKQETAKPIIGPKPVEFEPPPTLSKPASLPEQKAPNLSKKAELPVQKSPPLAIHAKLPEMSPPNLISPTDPKFQGPPVLTAPAVMPDQSKDWKLTKPATLPDQPAPTLTMPTAPGTQGPPVLTMPTDPKFQDPPNLLKPTAPGFEPPPNLLQPAIIPFEPAPPLLQPTPPDFQPPPNLLKPAQIPFEPPPNLLQPTAPVFQGPPVLLAPTPPGQQTAPDPILPHSPRGGPGAVDPDPTPYSGAVFGGTAPETHPGAQPTPTLSLPQNLPSQPAPTLIQPRPVEDKGNSKFINIANMVTGFEQLLKHQKEYFDRQLPKAISNLVQRVLPRPGNIDPDLLPSTIFTKALNVANQKIMELENEYGYHQIANVGNKVSGYIGGVMGVNYRPDGAYESSDKAPSLKKINDELRKSHTFSKANIFDPTSPCKLQNAYKDNIANDPKYAHVKSFDSNQKYRLFMDRDDGLMDNNLTVNQAARGSYFPFYFVDLRPNRDKKYRTVFFQPYNLEIQESFAPSWNTQNFMGRVDPVATYQNTTRSISLNFKLVAFHPNDLKVIYGKLKWLTSMVYPEYSPNMRYNSGPVVKMRLGNLINASSYSVPLSSERPGVPGFINSLDYAYDNIWELEDDWQVPRSIDVSLSFTVLHELPIGIIDGQFGGIGEMNNGVYSTPAQINDKPSKHFDVVDSRLFRSVGPDKPEESDGENNY